MPNENCLAGIKCPKCGSLGPFQAQTVAWAEWTDSGVDEYVEPDFLDDGKISCGQCQHCGRVDDFQEENQEVGRVLQLELLLKPGDQVLEHVLDLLSDLRDDNSDEIVEWRRLPGTSSTLLTGAVDAKIAAREWELNSYQQQGLGLDVEEDDA